MNKNYKTGREFLRPAPRTDAIAWEVYVSPFSGKASGMFDINWRGTSVRIHTLDQTSCGDQSSDVLYVQKLETVLESVSAFRKLLQNRENGRARHWLNPLDTSASGSVGYCFDKTPDKDDYTIYFELASCTEKFRMWIHQYNPRSLKDLDRIMKKVHHQLCMHHTAMTELQLILVNTHKMMEKAEAKTEAA